MNNFLTSDVELLSLTELSDITGGGFWRDLGYGAATLAIEFKEAIINALK